ncbi:MAG: hypothetical protein DMD97_27365, partial [Candidatus Rokuibacteriota bacterium]
MDGASVAMMFGAGIAGGIVTAIAGGSSLITFPALLAAGLPPIVANASNAVGLLPGNFMAGFADPESMPRWNRSLLALVLVCVAGSVAGAVLLLVTPEKAFTAVVPLLIGFATLLFAMSGRVRLWIESRPASGARARVSADGLKILLLIPVAIYVGAGIAGGIVTAIAGGSSLITFPALLAAGLPPIVANASNAVGLLPGNFMAGFADPESMPRWNRSLLALVLVCVAGSVAGAVLLLVTPEKAFTAVVPLLIGFATLLFAMSGRVRLWIESRPASGARARVSADGLKILLLIPVAIYGGYFGAGMSVMLLGILSVGIGEFRTTNVIKNLLAGLTSLVASIVFVVQGMVAWPPTTVMMVGALIGGFTGGRLVRVLRPELVRWIVIAVGTILTAVYA